MSKKTKIAILGVGGVGGYFGGMLAKKYAYSETYDIIFIARGASEKVIRDKGIKLITATEEITVFPDIVSNDPNIIGNIDFLICCVKNYDLEESLSPLKNCISNKTIILPLLNGVDASERILRIVPEAQVWDGCAYIISRLIEPGVVKVTGNLHSIYFGYNPEALSNLSQFKEILKGANIEGHLSDNIKQTVWEKYLFISTIGSLTSYLDESIGHILANLNHKIMLRKLMQELKSIADAKKINLPEDIIEKTIAKMESMPYEATSSMHSDFKKGGKTEYASLTGHVTKLGKEMKISVPTYDLVSEGLQKNLISFEHQ
jgi:2-dehydropantoate 2-reductase